MEEMGSEDYQTHRKWLENNMFHRVSTEMLAHSLWKKLESLYKRKRGGKKTFLIQKLVSLKHVDGGSLQRI